MSQLDQLLDPSFSSNLEDVPLEDIRSRRAQLQEAESGLSYVRRLIQGRLDIAAASLAASSSGNETDLSGLIEKLPEILADEGRAFSPMARPEGLQDFDQASSNVFVQDLVDETNEIVSAETLGSLVNLAQGEITRVVDSLGDLERRVSDLRKQVHEQLDLLQVEIVRRYKTGEANVDSLLG